MSDSYTITAAVRSDLGKGASRRLRRAGQFPAVVYGDGGEAVSLTLQHNQVWRYQQDEGFYSHILDLDVEGKVEQVVLRDIQRHPYKNQLLHIDFQRVNVNEAVHVHVPLHFLNEEACVGVKQGGGSISHVEVEIEVSCLPKDLPEFIEIDVANMNVGESLHISDLTLPEGVTSVALSHGEDQDRVVVSVHGKPGGAGDDEAEEAAAAE